VSPHIQLFTTLTRTSFSRRQVGLLLAVTNPERMVCVSPTTLSPGSRFFAWRDAHNDAGQTVQFPHAQHLQPDLAASTDDRVGTWLHRHPERRRVLQSSVSVKRHLSCIFPAHPRSLASVLIPRPAARRVSAFTAFRKSFRQNSAQDADEKIFRTFRKSAAWHLGAGHLASLRARVSRGQSGQIQGETQWHSTKTNRN
jgi:hypothetical protein